MDFTKVGAAGLDKSITSILLTALLLTAKSCLVAGSNAVISAAPEPPKPIDPTSW